MNDVVVVSSAAAPFTPVAVNATAVARTPARAAFAPLAEYQNFLLLIGSVFAPLFGVVLVDHFILRQRRAELAPRRVLRWDTLVAWGCGVALYHLLAARWPELGATLPALLAAGVLQWGLGRISLGRGNTPA